MSKRASTSRIAGGNGGFTLIEVLVALGLLVMVLAMLVMPLWSGYAYMEKGNARAEALAAAREALDTMSRELAEAMYIFDPPDDRRMIVFYPGSGTQPAPAVAVRYWRALRDPAREYSPFWVESASAQARDSDWNPCYLARSEIPNPQYVPPAGHGEEVEDGWNDSTDLGRPTYRALYVYPDNYVYLGAQWPESQPGWPWLEAFRQYPGAGQLDARYQWYLDRATGLTPDSLDYDLTQLTFTPRAVGNEALAPVRPGGRWPPDYSVYRSRWPLWCRFSLQASASGVADRIDIYDQGGTPRYFAVPSPRDVDAGGFAYRGDVCVYEAGANPAVDDPIFNCERYPSRQGAAYGFGIDYDRGRLLFAFPARQTGSADSEGELELALVTSLGGTVLAGSDQVRVSGVYYRRVASDPGEGEYTLVHEDIDGDGGLEWAVRFDPTAPPSGEVVVTYRYHNCNPNDLIVANYQTKSIIDIDLTVAKRDKAGRVQAEGQPGVYPTRQEAHLGATVKLHNVVR